MNIKNMFNQIDLWRAKEAYEKALIKEIEWRGRRIRLKKKYDAIFNKFADEV